MSMEKLQPYGIPMVFYDGRFGGLVKSFKWNGEFAVCIFFMASQPTP